MTMRNFIIKGILPVLAVAILLYVGKHIYYVDGSIDWFRLCLVVGIPVGLPHMFIIFPLRGDPASSVAMIAICLIIGSVFGSIITIFILVRATVYIVGYPIAALVRTIKRKTPGRMTRSESINICL